MGQRPPECFGDNGAFVVHIAQSMRFIQHDKIPCYALKVTFVLAGKVIGGNDYLLLIKGIVLSLAP